MAAQSRVQVFALGVHKIAVVVGPYWGGRYRAREIPAPERDQLEQAAKSQLHLYLFLYNVFKPPYIFFYSSSSGKAGGSSRSSRARSRAIRVICSSFCSSCRWMPRRCSAHGS